VDIAFFKNPIPALQKLKHDFVIQSNAPWPKEQAANGTFRIRSGFYWVRSTPIVIEAMSEIVEHAAQSNFTKQPSFAERWASHAMGTTSLCHGLGCPGGRE
jgi:hypothetical protein